MSEPIVLESNQNHATITDSGVCPTLSASMGLDGGYVPMITEKTKENIEIWTSSKESHFTKASNDEIANTLVATDYKDPPLVAIITE